jgi:ubiquinone/menaquinone biosynthesis C-methylase UbiE
VTTHKTHKTHKYNPENGAVLAGHLNNSLRRWFLSPERIFREIGIRKDEVWVDVGCGTGFFTIPLSRMASKVFAIDISPRMLEMLEIHIQAKQLRNVLAMQSEENVIPLAACLANGIFMGFVAHELDDPERFLTESARCLKPGGKLIIVDFSRKLSFGPPMNERIIPRQFDEWADLAGLAKGRTWQWGRSTIGLEYIK